MGRVMLRVIAGGLALYLYSQGQILGSVLCLLALAASLLRPLLLVLPQLVTMRQEYKANSVLIYTFTLDRVFEHPAVDRVFAKLCERGKAPTRTLEEWRTMLSTNYRRKYKRDDSVGEVRFHVKSNVLFINQEPDFRDKFYHELEIPYRLQDTGEPQDTTFEWPEIEAQLNVRVLVLNGLLVLQVGRFSKEYSPNILRGDGLAVYETYATITSFPLIYFSEQHGIPARYLALVAQATPSYKASHNGRATRKTSNDMYRDWRTLNQDVAAYCTLCDSADKPWGEYDYDKVKRLSKQFEAKRQPLLDAEGYKTLERQSDDDWQYPDMGHTYWNKYGQVFFRNVNANRDSTHESEWLGGYHEELP